MRKATREQPEGVKGWLLVLCVLLIVWGPVQLGLVASSALAALPIRGLPLGLLLMARIAVTAFGLAAGLALFSRRPVAVPLARVSLVLSALTDVVVYTTPYFPSNRMPGDDMFFIAASLAYATLWLVYLSRSRRVRNTYA
jgi:hypothetical protein